MKKCLILLVMLMLFIVSCGGGEDSDSEGSEVIVFKDVNLEKCIRNKIQKAEGDITAGDVSDVEYVICQNMGIKVIDGIEKLANAYHIVLRNNDIEDFSMLKNIDSLKRLDAEGNRNIDLNTLSNLNNIEELYLDDCDLSTIEQLEKLSDLKILSLRSNQLTYLEDIGWLTGLSELFISSNYFQNEDLTILRNLVNLKKLDIGNNCIDDFTVINQMKADNPDLEVQGDKTSEQDISRCE